MYAVRPGKGCKFVTVERRRDCNVIVVRTRSPEETHRGSQPSCYSNVQNEVDL